MKIPEFKIRASQLGKLMTEPRSKADKEAGNLSETAKSYIKQGLKEQIYNRRAELKSKYLDKGNMVEDDSIAFAGKILGGKDPKNNKEQFENEYLTGEPDVILEDKIVDMKNSGDLSSFPLLETKAHNKDYYGQLQAYMILLGYDKAELCYTLMDMPEELLQREFQYNNPDGLDYDTFSKKYKYDDVDDRFRVKVFEFTNDRVADKVKQKVEKAREYIKELLKENNIK